MTGRPSTPSTTPNFGRLPPSALDSRSDLARQQSERRSVWRHLLVVTAVGQLVSPILVVVFGGGAVTSDTTSTPITPPGWTFTIWGAIVLVSLAYALVQNPLRRTRLHTTYHRLAVPLTIVFTLYSVWLAAAVLNWSWVTVLVFAAMLVGLLAAARAARNDQELAAATGPRRLVGLLLGLYAGWTTVAVFVNLSTALRQAGAPTTTTAGLVWQGLLLVAATALAIGITWWWQAPLPYVAAALWALVGAATATAQQNTLPLTGVCVVGTAAVVAGLVLTRNGRERLGPSRTERSTGWVAP